MTAKTTTEATAPTNQEYAGFWLRLAAALFDGAILAIVFVLLVIIWYIAIRSGAISSATATFVAIAGYFLFMFVFRWLYFAMMESSLQQATIGKYLIGIYVAKSSGERVSFARSTGRHFAKVLASIAYIGFIMIAFTEKKQGLHDLITDCVVLKGRINPTRKPAAAAAAAAAAAKKK